MVNEQEISSAARWTGSSLASKGLLFSGLLKSVCACVCLSWMPPRQLGQTSWTVFCRVFGAACNQQHCRTVQSKVLVSSGLVATFPNEAAPAGNPSQGPGFARPTSGALLSLFASALWLRGWQLLHCSKHCHLWKYSVL